MPGPMIKTLQSLACLLTPQRSETETLFHPLKASHMTHPYRVGEREDAWAFGNFVTNLFVASTGLKNRLYN